MWVARDFNKELALYRVKPRRIRNSWFSPGYRDCVTWWSPSYEWPDPFPELKWEDEPVNVNVLVEVG